MFNCEFYEIGFVWLSRKTKKNEWERRMINVDMSFGWILLGLVGSCRDCILVNCRGFFVFGVVVVWNWSDLAETWWKELLLLPSRVAPSVISLWSWVPAMCAYLPKCQENSVFITWKYPKCVFSFTNSLLKNQIIEWWKQKLKTNPNTPFCCGTHQF